MSKSYMVIIAMLLTPCGLITALTPISCSGIKQVGEFDSEGDLPDLLDEEDDNENASDSDEDTLDESNFDEENSENESIDELISESEEENDLDLDYAGEIEFSENEDNEYDMIDENTNEESEDDSLDEANESEHMTRWEFITNIVCANTENCGQGLFCLKRSNQNEGICVKNCDPTTDCPLRLCGEGCPSGKSCPCQNGAQCTWDVQEPYPTCKQKCSSNNIVFDCLWGQVCMHQSLPQGSENSDGTCVTGDPERTDGCPKPLFASALFKGDCFPIPGTPCDIKCPPGYGCSDGHCKIMCPNCGSITQCTWRTAPFCATDNECLSEGKLCNSDNLPCCGTNRCCKITTDENKLGYCMPDKDCFTGNFLDPY